MKTALIACCSQKLAHAAPARELYTSDLFKKSVAWAEKHCDQWFILSAKHHLVKPDQIIKPYDLALSELRKNRERAKWECRTSGMIRKVVPMRSEVVLLAGSIYRDEVESCLHYHCCETKVPMQGLGIGQQKQWLLMNTSAI